MQQGRDAAVSRVRWRPVLRRVLAGRAWSGWRAGTPHQEVCLGEEARDGGVTMRSGERALRDRSRRVNCRRRHWSVPAGIIASRPSCRAGRGLRLGRSIYTRIRTPLRSQALFMSHAVCALALAFRTPLRIEVHCTPFAAFALPSAAAASACRSPRARSPQPSPATESDQLEICIARIRPADS